MNSEDVVSESQEESNQLPFKCEATREAGNSLIEQQPVAETSNAYFDEMQKLVEWKGMPFAPCGLINVGSSCYAGVVLQCFMSTKILRAYVLKDNHKQKCSLKKSYRWCFLCELQKLIEHTTKYSQVPPSGFMNNLKSFAPALGSKTQEDAHEFFVAAVQAMFDAVKGDTDLSEEDNFIHQLYYGRMRSQSQCKCGNVSNTFDKFGELHLSIDNLSTLEDALEQYTHMDDVSDWKCTTCQCVGGRRQILFQQAPNVLCIELKRFEGSQFRKVKFPTVLDIERYMCVLDETDYIYDLYAIIVHLDGIKHYICYMKGYGEGWTKFDDDKVSSATESEALNQDSYMLMYNRRRIRSRPLEGTKSSHEHGEPQSAEGAQDIFKLNLVNESGDGRVAIEDNVANDKNWRRSAMNLSSTKYTIQNIHPGLSSRLISELKRDFIIVEDMERDEILRKIEKLMAPCDPKKDLYHFRLPKRGPGSCVYHPVLEQLCLRRKGTYKCPSKREGSLQRARQIWYVLDYIRKLLIGNKKADPTRIYYSDIKLFNEDRDTVSIVIALISMMLECTRYSMNIRPSSKGSIIGPITLKSAELNININCAKAGSLGARIPNEAQSLDIQIDGEARYIFFLEKEAIFTRLSGDDFHLKEKCILITGKGQADVATRVLLRKLKDILKVPVFGFVDPNPSGLNILSTVRFGSEARCYDNLGMTSSDLSWIGMHPTDLVHMDSNYLQPLGDNDVAMLKNFMEKDYICDIKEWRGQIQMFSATGMKGDVESLLVNGMFEDYIRTRIEEALSKTVPT